MKYFKIYAIKAVFCMLFACGLTGCSNDENEETKGNTNYPTTSFSKIELSEVLISDAQTVTTTQTYSYNAGRLSDYISRQTFLAIEPVEIKSTTTVTYSDHQAIVTDEFGNVSTYTLNDKGYAISCTRKEGGGNTRTYIFSYLTNTEEKCFLENITEKLEDGNIYAAIDIDYNNYRALQISMHVDTYDQKYTATTPENKEIKNTSEIPCLFLAELYPLSLHSAALYGKLLGEPFNYLITQIIPDNNTESNETTTYTYNLDNRGIVTSCDEKINSYGKDYKRTVNYIIK